MILDKQSVNAFDGSKFDFWLMKELAFFLASVRDSLMRRRVMQRMNMEGYGKLGILDSEITQNNSLKYYCMSCGTQHKGIECPKCGSKMKKVGF